MVSRLSRAVNAQPALCRAAQDEGTQSNAGDIAAESIEIDGSVRDCVDDRW